MKEGIQLNVVECMFSKRFSLSFYDFVYVIEIS
jgi:hypothetical protein